MPNYVIIVAGGKGLRMGGDVPKQFLPIGGMPVLMRTLQAFHDALSSPRGEEDDGRIILVLPADQQAYWQQLCSEYSFAVPHQIATGGETRFHSVRNGLALIPDGSEGIVGVHDGVRPFVSPEVIRRCYEAARVHGAVVPVIPVVETLRRLTTDAPDVHDTSQPSGSQTVDRNRYRLVQTPQTFSISLLKEAYLQPYRPEFTDDASVVEAMQRQVVLVEGNRENIKITTPSDISYAEYLCSTSLHTC